MDYQNTFLSPFSRVIPRNKFLRVTTNSNRRKNNERKIDFRCIGDLSAVPLAYFPSFAGNPSIDTVSTATLPSCRIIRARSLTRYANYEIKFVT